MQKNDTFRTLKHYPDTLPDVSGYGAHKRITIDEIPIDELKYDDEFPLVSIITPSFNSEKTIERTIDSVLGQTYRNVEHIIIDGGSTDATVEKIRSRESALSYWHSHADRGIADAFNAGVAVSRGPIIGIVNSDDWMSPNQIEEGVQAILGSGADFSFGDMTYYSGEDPLFVMKGRQDYDRKIRYANPPVNHPSILARRSMYEKVGLFDLKWKVAMDYDWVYRCHRAGFRGKYTDKVCANMSDGGVSDTEFLQAMKEGWVIIREGGVGVFVATSLFIYRYTKMLIRRLLGSFLGQQTMGRVRTITNPDHERISN